MRSPNVACRSGAGPLADAGRGVYDVVDLSADFLDAAEANATAFTREAIVSYLRVLAPGGMVSIPVSIRDFPVYALRMLATVRAALLSAGIADPAAHVVVYRSAWNVRILLSRDGWCAARIAAARKFCDDRSFDVSWYPGIDVAKARAGIYNDLPAVSFDKGEVESGGPDDAIADEARAVLSGQPTPSREQFNLSPITLDRPFFYAVLRLDRIGTILKRLEILPQAEVGALVNLAVLAQAVVIAVLVLLVPLAAPARIRAPAGGRAAGRGLLSGAGLGLPVHRNLPDREGQLLAERPDQRFCPRADRHAGVLRPRQRIVRPVRGQAAPRHGDGGRGRAGLVRGRAVARCSR